LCFQQPLRTYLTLKSTQHPTTARCEKTMFRHVFNYSNGSHGLRSLRRYATVADLSSYPPAGDRLHGFILNKIKHVPELHLTALQLQHDKTGAEYLHIARDDQNNVFAINFKTNPADDTGLPHILEHVTLCGSEKYP